MYKGSTSAGAWLQRKVVVEDLRKTGKATEEVNVSRKIVCLLLVVFCFLQRSQKRESVFGLGLAVLAFLVPAKHSQCDLKGTQGYGI